MSAFEDELHWELSWLVRAEVPDRAVRLTVRDLLVARMERGRLGARQVSENVQTTVRVAWPLRDWLCRYARKSSASALLSVRSRLIRKSSRSSRSRR